MTGIRRALTLPIIVLTLAVLAFTGGLNLSAYRSNYTNAIMGTFAVAAGQTVREIEFAVKYGKPLENFYGLESHLLKPMALSQHLQQVALILPDGRLLHNQNGPVAGQSLPPGVQAANDFSQGSPNRPWAMVRHADQCWLLLPIRDSNSNRWIGTLGLQIDAKLIATGTAGTTRNLVVTLGALGAVAALAQFLLVGQAAAGSGFARFRRRLRTGTIVVLGVAQLCVGAANLFTFRSAYAEMAKATVAVNAAAVQQDISRVLGQGMPYSQLYELDRYLDAIVGNVPQVESLALVDGSGMVMSRSRNVTEASLATDDGDSLRYPLSADAFGVHGTLVARLSRSYLQAYSRELILSALSILAISVLFLMEATILQFLLLRWQLHAAGEDDEDGAEADEQVARPLIYLLTGAQSLSASFVPILAQRLYGGPVLGIPKSILIAAPISVELLCAGVGTYLGGRLTDRRGWRFTFYAGLAVMAVGMLLSAVAPDSVSFAAARAVAGMGAGTAFIAVRHFANALPTPEGRARSLAGYYAGMAAGLNCGIMVGAALADRVGFGWVFVASGAACLVAAFYSFFLTSGVYAGRSRRQANGDGRPGSLSALLQTPAVFVFLLLIILPQAVASMFITYYLPVFSAASGASTSTVGRALLVNGLVVSFAGPYLAATAARRIGLVRAIVVAGLIEVVALGIFALQGSMAAMLVACVMMGLAAGLGNSTRDAHFTGLAPVCLLGTGLVLVALEYTQRLGSTVAPLVYSALTVPGPKGLVRLLAVLTGSLLLFWLFARRRKVGTEAQEWALITRTAATLALAPALVYVVMGLLRYRVALIAGTAGFPPVSAGVAWYLCGLDLLLVLSFLAITVYIVWKSPHWFDVFTVTALMLYAIMNLGSLNMVRAFAPEAGRILGWLGWLLPMQVFCLFPSGRYAGPGSKALALLSAVIVFVTEYGGRFSPHQWRPAWTGVLVLLALDLAVVMVLLFRFRKLTDMVQRQQVKLAVFGLAVGYMAYWAELLPRSFLPVLQSPSALLTYTLWVRPLFFILVAAIPVCFAVSILKYRLWNVDFVINRTLVYSALTGSLAILDVGLVQFAEVLLPNVVDNAGFVVMAVAGLNTFAFRPLEQNLERLIGRYFQHEDGGPALMEVRSALAAEMKNAAHLPAALQALLTRTAGLADAENGAFFLDAGPGPMFLAARSGPPAGSPSRLPVPDRVRRDLLAGRPAAGEEPFSLYLPLVGASGALFGAVALGPPRRGGPYRQEELENLAELAASAANTLEAVLMDGERRRREAGTRSVLDFGQWLAQGRDAKQILDATLLRAKSLAGADTALVCHCEPGVQLLPAGVSSDSLDLLVTTGGALAVRPVPLYLPGSGEPNRNYAACRAALDMRSTPEGESLLRDTGFAGSFTLAVPLCSRANQVLAVLEVNDPHEPESGDLLPFTPALVQMLELVAGVAALALETAEREEKLSQEVQSLRRQVGLISTGGSRIGRIVGALEAILAESEGQRDRP